MYNHPATESLTGEEPRRTAGSRKAARARGLLQSTMYQAKLRMCVQRSSARLVAGGAGLRESWSCCPGVAWSPVLFLSLVAEDMTKKPGARGRGVVAISLHTGCRAAREDGVDLSEVALENSLAKSRMRILHPLVILVAGTTLEDVGHC